MENQRSDYRKKLEEDLLGELEKHSLNLIPDELVKVSAALLVKMYQDDLEYELIRCVGYGSIWAWSFDEIADDPTIPKSKKLPFINEFVNLIYNHNLEETLIQSNLPKTGKLMEDCINTLIQYKELNHYEKALIRREYIDLILGAQYEVAKMGEKVVLEESLYHRAYSYATPFYGALVLVGAFSVSSWEEFWLYRRFLFQKGRVTRIMNDIATYEKEKGGDEVNYIYALKQFGLKEEEALKKAVENFKKEYTAFLVFENLIDKNFFRVEKRFVDVHNEAYNVKDIREISSTSI